MNWSEPCVAGGARWYEPLVAYWAIILAWVEAARKDAIGGDEWKAALVFFDGLPDPPTVEEANLRWREFVVAVWRLRDGFIRRRVRR